MIEQSKTRPSALDLTTVAIVDDDIRTASLVQELVDRMDGFMCLAHYPSVESALEGLPVLMPNIVLAGVDPPCGLGITCVQNLRHRMPATHFVLLSVYDDADVIFEGLQAGAVGYLLKRAIVAELERTLQGVLLGGAQITSSVARKIVRSFQPPPAGKYQFSEREDAVIDLLARGRVHREICETLAITPESVHSCIRRICEKLYARSRR